MKSAIIFALAAGAALANPLDKRAMETQWEFETVTVTVTGKPPVATSQTKWTDSAPPVHEAPVPEAPAAPAVSSAAPVDAESSWMDYQPSATASGGAPIPTKPVSSEYAQGLLDSHNNHRANHSAPALSWSDELAAIAEEIGGSCVYAHNTKAGGGGYGQNIGAGAPPSDVPGMITNQMYNDEIGLYPGYGGEPDMGNFEKWGHFSQIIWKSSVEVGCATVHCPGGLGNTGSSVSPYFTICNYKPAGNFAGEYGSNVLKPQGMPMVTL